MSNRQQDSKRYSSSSSRQSARNSRGSNSIPRGQSRADKGETSNDALSSVENKLAMASRSNHVRKMVKSSSNQLPTLLERKDVVVPEVVQSRTYKKTNNGPVDYIDASGLQRDAVLPKKSNKFVIFCVILAALIGCACIYLAIDRLVLSETRQIEQYSSIVADKKEYNLPTITELIDITDEEILAQFQKAGFNLVDVEKQTGSSLEGIDVYKLADGYDSTKASEIVSAGLANSDIVTLAEFLNGSWRLDTDRSAGGIVRVRYADFTSGDAKVAVDKAAKEQGFEESDEIKVTGSGVDDNGNTYVEGTMLKNELYYSWRVSAIVLSEVYGIEFPSTAIFVGVKIEKPQE